MNPESSNLTTERLYYGDSYRTEFDARPLAAAQHDGRPALVLDRTCFYPTSGGQPYDTGRLDAWPVVDVVAADGILYHILEQELAGLSLPPTIHGVVDWSRRYDHMQQHSGQHLISQVFYRLFGYETVSVHFGAEDSTLDLDTADVEPARWDEAERYANDLVYQALPIMAYEVADAELHRIPLRRPPKVTGKIRIVEIDKFDYSACGGTHCRTTAEAGPVKFLRTERRRGQMRVTFKCGKRAYADYALRHHLLTSAANLYSTDVTQVPELIARSLEQIKELQRQTSDLSTQLAAYEAAELAANAPIVGAVRVVARWFEERSPDAIKSLANLLQQYPGTVALLGCAGGGKATFIFARSADSSLHMGNLLRAALSAFGGNGGGRPDFAQGGGVAAEQGPALLAFAQERVGSEGMTR
jgi:alanyl-tRNA synthetase